MLVSEEEEQKRRVHPLLLLCASLTSLKVCAETLRVLRMTLCDVTKGTDDSTVAAGQPANHMLVPSCSFVFSPIQKMWMIQQRVSFSSKF